MLKDSKDAIKSRMIRMASGIWGYSDTQDINSFDPIVGMMLGALTEELYAIAGEIKRTDARLVEKLFELLFNQHIFTHQPAHGLVTAQPTQPVVTLSDVYQFYSVKKIPRTVNDETVYENKTVHFTPTAGVKLFRGEVNFFSFGNQLFEISGQVKEPLGTANEGIIPDYSRLYAGINLDTQIESIDGLSFLFTLKNKQNEEWFNSSVSISKWKINGQRIDVVPGFELHQNWQDNTLAEMVRLENDISYKTCRFVNDFYRNKFMMVDGQNYPLKRFVQADSVPGELKRRFPAHVMKSVPKDLYWIEIELPQPVPLEIAADLNVTMNCFPVVNRELNEFTYLLTKGMNIIPLNSGDLFFDINRVADTKGFVYKPLNSFNIENIEEEGYLLRQGGIARFDSRDAKETIQHLIDLIRDERAGFSLLGADLISSELKQLDQIISRLKQRIEAGKTGEDPVYYILLNCKSGFERASVQFWTTSGDVGNNIKAGTKLDVHEGSDIDTGSVFLVTQTSGGRQKLSREDKMDKLRRTLLSKGRVVTQEDIKALCFEHFGSDLQRVEIRKGVQPDLSPVKGFVRSLDIHLLMNNLKKFSEDEIVQKTEGLKVRLKQESLNLLPYRIFVS